MCTYLLLVYVYYITIYIHNNVHVFGRVYAHNLVDLQHRTQPHRAKGETQTKTAAAVSAGVAVTTYSR